MEHLIFDKQRLMQLSEKLKAAWQEMPETEPDFLEQYSPAVQEEKERAISRGMRLFVRNAKKNGSKPFFGVYTLSRIFT